MPKPERLPDIFIHDMSDDPYLISKREVDKGFSWLAFGLVLGGTGERFLFGRRNKEKVEVDPQVQAFEEFATILNTYTDRNK